MSYATAKDIPVDTIPVIDIAPVRAGDAVGTRHVAAQMQQAAGDIGFFYITNHGVDDNLIQETLHVAREFFELPEIDKRSVKVTPKKRGYIEPSTAKMKGGKKLDFRETFLWGREFTSETLATLAEIPLIGPNQWPQALPNMPEVFNNYFETCVELGRELLRVFALALGVESDYFAGRFKHTMARGSALYYPPQPAEMGDDQFGIGPHTDWGVLTLLYQDDVGGLQVRGRDGKWLTAHPIADTYVVNVGDCLERWTNKHFLSNEHRALNTSSRVRQALVTFVDPDFDTDIIPIVAAREHAQLPPITCGEQVLASFRNAYGA